jgi:lysozyme
MPYLNTHDRTTSTTNNDKFQPAGRVSSLFGVFVGFVKDTKDVQKNGRLRVWIPEFGSAPENQDGWIIVNYCSPFAGATNNETISKANVESFEGTQTSYGMWMVPPDINNQVLIMFINGDASRGVWIGSLYNQYMNNMVPAMAADSKNWQYPGKIIPVAEYNKWDLKVTQPDQASHPYEKTKFKGLGNQGLITDQGRGITTSSARRESPSSVFGILTPGPVVDSNASPANIRRKGGSSFIMDDATGSEYVQLTTKSGAQIKLDETNGFVYLINRDGTAWVQMDQKGNIDIFGATNISMRAQKDINLRADRNINIEAGQNIYMKAAKDTTESTTTFTYDVNNIPNTQTIPLYKYVGEGAGQGGNIVVQALNNMHTKTKKNSYITIGENFELKVTGNIDMSADGEYNLTAPSIKNIGSVKIRGPLDVTSEVKLGNSLGVNGSINGASLSLSGNISANVILGTFPGLRSGPGAKNGGPGTAGPSVSVSTPPSVTPAEIKPLVEKINILATWSDPESKFKRDSESLNTTVSTLPTYEPCPEHETFTFTSITGYIPVQTEASKTYDGSGGAGSSATAPPVPNTDPGANNKDIPQPSANESAVTKNFNMRAYECQLKIHEGVKYVSYLDSVRLPTGGIGHLLRANEVPLYWASFVSQANPGAGPPVVITADQVSSWFQQDAPISIAGATRLIGIDVWAELSDIRKRACADLCYNMGESRLSKFVRFIAAMKAGNYNAAGQSLRESKWFTQVGRRGPNIITMIVQNIDPNGCDKKFPPQ